MGMIKNACDSAHFECCQHNLNSAVVGSIHLAMETKAAILSVLLFAWIVSSFCSASSSINENNDHALQLPAELHRFSSSVQVAAARFILGLFSDKLAIHFLMLKEQNKTSTANK